MKGEKYILHETTSAANRKGREKEFFSALIVNLWNGPFREFFKSTNRQIIRLLSPCIKSVESLFHTCISPVAHLYLEWLCMFKVDVVNVLSAVFEKFNARRMAVPWYTGLSPPR